MAENSPVNNPALLALRSQIDAVDRELLALYADPKDPAAARQIEGVMQVGYAPVVRRIPIPGPMSFARGLEITLTLDDAAFQERGAQDLCPGGPDRAAHFHLGGTSEGPGGAVTPAT